LQPRYELRMVRSDAPHITVVVRSRHRVRALAELSRRQGAAHMKLIPGCDLVVVDVRAHDGAPVTALPTRTTASPAGRLAA
jgi:hypothetical protein